MYGKGLILVLLLVAGIVLTAKMALSAEFSEPPRGVGNWPEERGTDTPRKRGDGTKIQSLGNHRAVIKVAEPSEAVWVRIPWRRRDVDADQKAVLIFDTKDDQMINLIRVDINSEYGDIIFQPANGAGEYYAYFMPYTYLFIEGSGDYRLDYDPPQPTADPDWINKNHLTPEQLSSNKWKELPRASVVEIQARTEFDRFDPMEVCATKSELSELAAKNPGRSYLLFPEDRRDPIRMKENLPYKWIQSGPSTAFSGEACKNEFYPFQIGLYSLSDRLFRVQVELSDLKTKDGKIIPSSALRCFNSGGIDQNGKPFVRSLSVEKGEVLPFWIGVQVPENAATGIYEGTIIINPRNAEATKVNVALTVNDKVLRDHGDSELWRHSRLRWLDSTIGIDDEVSYPYTPVRVNGQTVSVLGRDIKFSSTGLPESVVCFGNELLASPSKLVLESSDGQIDLGKGNIRQTAKAPAYVSMESSNKASALELESDWKVEYDGCITLSMRLKAGKTIDLKNVRVEIPFKKEHAIYMMGYNARGGYRPSGNLTGIEKRTWLGSVKAGMQCLITGELWDQTTAEYGVQESGDVVTLYANSGPISINAGEEKLISVVLLPTPLKKLDNDHWDWRYHQVWKGVMKPEDAQKQGVGILSVHHANELNPYINYPFLTTDKLLSYAEDAHSRGMKVKYYYTLRELTNYAVELWAFRAVEPNMFPNRNKRGGSSWLQEHVFSDYDRAWHSWSANTDVTDAAILTTGNSRLMNYYLEGLYWLAMNSGDDGLYIDGLAYDRQSMQRVRKALDKAKPGAVIDFHCGRSGAINANIFLKHFPYVSSIWFGEGFNYSDDPDYWMVEISGIPFGLFGEMLGTGSPWRGMLYGMTNRLGWGGDPRFIWKVWDDFGIKDSKMIGYWEEDCPVKTGRDDVLATVYVKKDKALISIGAWANSPVDIKLNIDWEKLGLKPSNLVAPEVKGFQEERTFSPNEAIPVAKSRGWLLLIGG